MIGSEIGNHETIDLVEGKKGVEVYFLVLIERMTIKEIIEKTKVETQYYVIEGLDSI